MIDNRSWETCALGELGEIITGKTPSTKEPDNFGGDIPFVKPGDLHNGGYISSTADFLSPKGFAAIPNLPSDAIMVTCIGNLGKVGISAKPCATNQQINSVIPSGLITVKYLYHYIRSMRGWLENESSATTVSIINKSRFSEMPVALPPLAEQKQIAAKLDELLAQVDTLKARLDAIPTILKRFRQSVLAAAVSGRLTEGWRDSSADTNANLDLEKITADRAKLARKPPEPYLRSETFIVPNSWCWTSLDSLSKKIVDGTHHTPTYTDSGTPFISVKDIRDGKIDFSSTKFISNDEHKELYKRCAPERGDLLITKSGTIGRTAIVDTDTEFSLFVSVALIKPASPQVNLEFINLSLRKWVNEIDVSSRIVGSAIKNLHLKDMKVLAIPFPPLKEQTEIVRRVEQLFAFADQVEQRVRDAQARVNHLTQSILAKAFRGELTADWRAQNPDLISGDNSAEALLARIRSARADAQSTKPHRKRKGDKQ